MTVPQPVGTYRTEPVSFVRRSRRLNPGQQRLWDEQRPVYLLDVPRAVASTSVDPGFVLDLDAAFGPDLAGAPVVVEIGSGQGEAVAAAAAQRPGTRFLAVEVYEPGLAHTARRAAHDGLANVRLVQANAPELLTSALAAASVAELWVFFPDPWRKARHEKRRLVDARFADLAARVLGPGGTLRFASDWEPYAEHVRDVLDAHAAFEPAPGRTADGWAPRFDGRVMTSFERKGLDAGRTVRDLAHVRRAAAVA